MNISLLNRKTIVLAILTSLSLFYYCAQPTDKQVIGNISTNSNKSLQVAGNQQLASNFSARVTATAPQNNPNENTPSVKIGTKSTRNAHLIIPGRTMQSAVFTPGLQTSIKIDGSGLFVPGSALAQIKNLSVTGLLKEDLPPIPAEISNVTKEYSGYRFLPHGTLFDSAATITMAYDATLLPEGYTAEDIFTFYFDETDHKWKALERDSVNHAEQLIVSNTLHFTDMINGVIKVPESPETAGYAPTSIKDIKAADPTAGIALIAPPSANSEGNADLSFPFKLPGGRAGMQPQLGLQYNSSGGSGWAGFGWGLSIPGVSVDVTWGVPRYLSGLESETYLMGGSQLTPLAHRGNYVARTSEKQFYPRIEGGFSKIIRHGDNPTNYWWETTSKNGIRNFFGGTPEKGVIPSAVTKDANGNIGYWALAQMRDVHDNFVSYSYEKPTGCGELLYVSEINYTGHDTVTGPYKITFLRDDASNTFERKDARIDARLGFVQRDNALLRRVNITYSNEIIRSYTLQYKSGAFFKTLLESISEIDADGQEFYTHRFDYFDDVQATGGYIPFAANKKWDLPDDNLKNPFLNPLNMFFDNVSALGGSGSSGGSGSVALTVGLDDSNWFVKSTTAGGSASYQASTSTGYLTLVDINGDGLSDKVYKKDGKVSWRANLQTTPNESLFGPERPVAGISNISISKSSGYSLGAEAHPPFSMLGYTYSKSKSKTKVYFSDFNADGLMDLANDGSVYFNHLDENGNPVFSKSSAETPNPLNANSTIDLSVLPDPAIEQAELEAQFPLQDAVKMWQAPYTGTMSIDAPVRLLEDTSAVARDNKLRDGVKVSIQYRGLVQWSQELNADDYNTYPAVISRNVNKGDRIYFRVQSRADGSSDRVIWDPEINYTSIGGVTSQINLTDANLKKISRFKASEDFILCGRQSIGMPKTGTIVVKTLFNKPVTTDSVTLEIIHTDTLGNKSIYSKRTFADSASVSNYALDDTFNILKNEIMQFRVKATSQIDWAQVKWENYLEYITIDDGTPVKASDGSAMLSFKTVPEFTDMYNNPFRNEHAVFADSAFMLKLGLDSVDSFIHPMKVTPRLNFPIKYGINDDVLLTVKTHTRLLGKHKYILRDSIILNPDTLIANVKLGDSLFFDYHFSDGEIAKWAYVSNVVIQKDTLHPIKASLSSTINPDYEIFGQLYRGWGQFDYDGNGDRANAPIDELLLKLTDKRNDNVNNMTDTSELNKNGNPLGDVFNIMIPYAITDRFIGVDEQVFITPTILSSSRRGEKSVVVEPLPVSGSGLSAITKVTEDATHSAAVGGDAGFASATYSHSWGKSKIITDMMDMNGDRYLDFLSGGNIQYTDVTGAISGATVNHALGEHISSSDANGFTLGGSYVTAKSATSMQAMPTKGVKVIIGDNFKSNYNSGDAEETSKSSIGISGNFSLCTDEADETWMDINGDGLPDKIYKNGTVYLNLGYSFAPAENWNFDAIRGGKSMDYGGGLGVNIKNGSITAGVSFSKTDNEANEAFMDVNADGLPDLVKGSSVYFNTGSGFADAVTWNGLGALDKNTSVGESANVGFTIGFGFKIIPIKICVNPGGSVSRGTSGTITQLADIDGDGMPDFISSDKENEMSVKSSTIGRTNMLKAVHRPMGSNFSIEYASTPASYNHPGGKWALASVESFDGLAGDGIDTALVTYEYANGFFNRRERQFYGFASVKTHFHNTADGGKIYRTVEQQFSNTDFYTKGALLAETLLDGNGRKQTGSENIYIFKDIRTGAELPLIYAQNDTMPIYVALSETKQFVYEGAASPLITTRASFEYDKMGNVSGYTDYSTGYEKDKVSVAIAYHSNASRYLHSTPSKQEVTTTDGLMRKRETEVNSFGDITRISQLIADGQTAQFDMEYDGYGNLTKITHPANYKGERMWYAYEYDPVLHTFVTRVTDAYGYASSSIYDYKWGVPTESTDKNNEKMRYTFDNRGLMKTVTGPYEIASGKPYTIAFEYHPEAVVPYAQTKHYDSVYNADIETYTFTDGLGRPVQVKKTAELFTDSASADTPGFVVSGKAVYDAFGRATQAYQPVFEPATSATTYNTVPDNIKPTTTQYDVLDRAVQITLPDGVKTSHAYGIGTYNSVTMYIDTITDALGHSAITFTNAKGQQAASVIKTASSDIITAFDYNAIGELLTVTDPKGNKTHSVYDKAGRRISVNQPDAGLTEFIYDNTGNILKKITANLRKQIPNGGAITYHYEYDRLIEIVYPKNIQNRVQYTYGKPGALYGRAGRLELVQDASGGQELFYGRLGEVEKTIRTVQLGEADMRTWIWSAQYDTWNRVQNMIYPDGEKVTYNYNKAGNLHSMRGEKLGRTYDYVSRMGYDKYEKQVYLQYGNGSVTTYNYEPERQRLTQMSVKSNGKQLMNNTYSYDVLNNILGITNSAASIGDIGGSTLHTYTYDDLNRLVSATGSYTGNNEKKSDYTLAMQYDIMGNILHKNQKHNKDNSQQAATSYDLSYKYENPKPNAASEIGERKFTYDENGNLTSWEDTITNDYRQLSWDEENRLSLISDNGYINRYVYDASGDRVIKSHGGSQGVYINGAPAGVVNHTDNNYTVYVNPYFVFQNDKFTKHYYAGSSRVTSKIGNGQFENQFRPGVFEITAGSVNYINRQQLLSANREEYIKQLGLPPGPPTMKGIYAEPEFTGNALPDAGTPTSTVPKGWPQKPVFAPAGGPPGAPIQWGDDITNETVEAGFGYVGTGSVEENLRYFYHSDHLGSTSYITDAKGDITQFIAYMPFGESFVEEHADWDSPFKFNAKELDAETGLYYYGARYYDPKISLWLGVDPFFEKFPEWSPYNYTLGNPINLIDPEGESPISIFAKQVLKQGIKKIAKETVEKIVKERLKAYMSKGWAKQLASDALDAVDMATTQSWWEYAIEVIPVAGDIYGGAKLTEQGIKVFKLIERIESRAEAIVKGLKGGSKALDKALGGKVGDMLDAHHLIPEQLLKENSVVQDAVAAGFDFTGTGNGVLVPGQHGSHSKYTESLRKKIETWATANKDYTPDQAKKFLESLAGNAKKAIQSNNGNVGATIIK